MPDARASSARPVVALLESRMATELVRLVENHGGKALCVPTLRECSEVTAETARKLIDEFTDDRYEICVFMTGVSVSLLFEAAEQLGRRAELVPALRRMTTVTRGPKPTAALRGFGVPSSLAAREPFTSAELIDALAAVELRGRRVMVLHYGERCGTLAQTLLARGALLEERHLYRWAPVEDQRPLADLASRMVQGDITALALTCQVQFRHLYAAAEGVGLGAELVRVLNDRMLVGAVGPTCETVLRAYGVRADVVPDHPKMGPLVIALMRALERRDRGPRASASLSILTHTPSTSSS
jgi:uroporphyrinogen-III synthase